MEISASILNRIITESRCDWTRGYVAGILDLHKPPREDIARAIIVGYGSDQKIAAIKGLRTEFGLALKDAKFMVDEFYSSGTIEVIIFPK